MTTARAAFTGVLIGNMGYTADEAEQAIAEGKLDAVAFGTSFLANPDLPERLALQALITESQRNVTGTVRVKLYKGGVYVAGRKSPRSLYNPHIATMEADPTKAYNQDDATGFIRLNGLRLRVNSKVNGVANLSKTVR